jgi:DNA-binding response OmpR family regulator
MNQAMQELKTTHRQDGVTTRRKLLVIDDEASFTRMLKINLETTGSYEVRVENDPRAAVAAALEFRPDLVLLDVMMPGVDGGDVASQLAADTRLSGIPVLFLTATVRHAEVEKRHGTFGGMRFLAKPVNMSELLGSLDTYFED